jgi:hypothetical protein
LKSGTDHVVWNVLRRITNPELIAVGCKPTAASCNLWTLYPQELVAKFSVKHLKLAEIKDE